MDVAPDLLRVRKMDGKEVQVTRKQAGCFDVAEKEVIPVAVGDRLLIQASRKEDRLFNGQIAAVKAIDRNRRITLEDGRIIGPAFAALAIEIGGIGLALWCNAISFIAVIIAVSLVRLPNNRGERRPVFAALSDGFRFARTTSAMRRMLVVMIVVVGLGSPFIAFVSQMATNVFGGDSTATSVLVMAQGVGAVAAAFTLGSITKRLGSWRVMVTAAMSFSVALILYGSAPTLWIAAPALTCVGVSYGFAFTSMAGIAQHNAPDEMRGRVLAVNSFVLGVLYPLGTVVQGAIADKTSLRTVTVGSGVSLAVALSVLHMIDRRRSAGPATPPEADDALVVLPLGGTAGE